jgi:hypothetical protein
VSACKSCGAELIWAKVRRRWNAPESNMPLDAEPVTDGEWLLADDGTASYVGREPSLIPEGRHRAHWATCSDPAKHRKR